MEPAYAFVPFMPAIPQSDRRLEDAKALLSPIFPFRECQANQLSVEASWVLGKEYAYMVRISTKNI